MSNVGAVISDLRDLVLVGRSMGGVVAYLLAQAQPGRITRLAVVDARPPFPRTRPVPARPAGGPPFDWAVVPAIVEEVNDPSMRWWKHLPEGIQDPDDVVAHELEGVRPGPGARPVTAQVQGHDPVAHREPRCHLVPARGPFAQAVQQDRRGRAGVAGKAGS